MVVGKAKAGAAACGAASHAVRGPGWRDAVRLGASGLALLHALPALAQDSPFEDEELVYLEADELVNDEAAQTLTATGSVVGRFGPRELRADSVIYDQGTGEILAQGDVAIVDEDGNATFAAAVELNGELETGNATNFTLRTPDGGLTAAALAQQNEDGSLTFFNAYYTACEVCEDDPTPSWRVKARQVTQDRGQNAIKYRDAVLEIGGVPVFYTPYLAHPDPSTERASGLLTPLFGFANDKGAFVRAPYFWAADPYTNVTVTPRVFSRVNPLLEFDVERQFATGDILINSSVTHGSIFDRDGDAFNDASVFFDPTTAPIGKRLRSHTFANGRFRPNDDWVYGFGVELTSDDNFLQRYDLTLRPNSRGLFAGESLRLINQAYAVGQGEDWRLSVSTFGFQDQRSVILQDNPTEGTFRFIRDNNDALPIIYPRVDGQKRFALGPADLTLFGNGVHLTRGDGVDYTRATVGAEAQDTFVWRGLEVQPFALARFDTYRINPGLEAPEDDAPVISPLASLDDTRSFSRTLGYGGVDVRYPFIRPGESVDIIFEPRAQFTHSVGDAKLENFRATDLNGNSFDLFQDSLATDLDSTLLWDPNKSTGFDFWQSGTRIDAGGEVAARWGGRDDGTAGNEASLFLGQSWASGVDDPFDPTSGLDGSTSDLVGEAEVRLGTALRARVRGRYDDDLGDIRRVDADAFLNLDPFRANLRYFRAESGATPELILNPTAPREELSGGVSTKLFGDWSGSYRAFWDIDAGDLRRQDFGLRYDDDCMFVEVIYSRDNNNRGIVGDRERIGFRFALRTLGGVG